MTLHDDWSDFTHGVVSPDSSHVDMMASRWRTIPKLTRWRRGARTSTLGRVRAQARQNGGTKSALEATQGQMNGFFGQLPYKYLLEEVAYLWEID